jgi:general secretion pathway protein A
VTALIVDEAHQLSPELLEEVRLLGNFETSDRKLLQIVLVGQNQLNDQLNLPQLWQLKQRIAVRLSLRRLDRQAVEEYIRFRWGKAGGQDPTPFSTAAFHAISTWSGGNPRLINVICENALLIAFSETSRSIDVQTVRDACEELQIPTPAMARSSPSFAGARPLMSLVEPGGEPGELIEPEGAEDGWAKWRPSLLQRLMRRSAAQDRARTRSRTGILSLKEP